MVDSVVHLNPGLIADRTHNTLQVTTHNVQGLNSPLKRRKVLNAYKFSTLNIIMLLETHFPARYCPKFLHSHFPNFYLANAENKTKGVAIVIGKTCKFSWISDTKDPGGRFIMVKGMIDGQLYTLVSYYTLNKGQAAFF